MNTTKTLVTALIALSGAAFTFGTAQAADADPGYPQPYSSALTRADVHSQVLAAQAQGLLRHGEVPLVTTTFEPMKTRSQVHAEAVEANRLGLIDSGEASPVYSAQQLDRIQMAGERALGMNVAAL